MNISRISVFAVVSFYALSVASAQEQATSESKQLVEAGKVAKQRVEQQQASYIAARESLFQSLDAAIARIPNVSTDFSAERAALLNLRQVVAQLRSEGEKAFQAHSKYLEASNAYHLELPRAAEAFDRIAAQFQRYQQEERYSDHRTDYANTSRLFASLAERCRVSAKQIEPEMAGVVQNMPYLERSVVFLGRLEEALETIPEFQAGDDYDRLVFQLRNYVASYQRMRSSLQQFSNRLAAPETRSTTPANVAAFRRDPYSSRSASSTYTGLR